ncbi:MAG: methylenetetrahydrofolate reductase [NAD(P)H] [Chthoniobacterales bacterium]
MENSNLEALFKKKSQTLSFEFFPPKNERGWFTLEDTIDQLAALGPDFVSVTYGAGGGTREKTRELVVHLQEKTGLRAMAHLTCVNATRAELSELLKEYSNAGIRNILALRGDPPKGQERFIPTDGGCAYASDLIELIRENPDLSILCAAFPERHPDAESREADWKNLAEKFRKGACAAITQCFFDPQCYFELLDYLEKELGDQPRVLPGILPVVDWDALQRFCKICGANIPPALAEHMAPFTGDKVAARKAGIAYTVTFCRQLLERGAPGIHLYALNRSTAAAEIVTALRLSGHLE